MANLKNKNSKDGTSKLGVEPRQMQHIGGGYSGFQLGAEESLSNNTKPDLKRNALVKKRIKDESAFVADGENKREVNKTRHVVMRREKGMSFLSPTLRLRVEGFNQTRVLNALNVAGVKLRRVKVVSARLLMLDLSKKDSKKTFAILQKMCYDYTIVAESGISTLPFRFLSHIGIAVGAIVFIVLLALSTQVVWRIEISGNEAVDSQLIMRQLSENGLKVGAFKNKVDLDAVTASIRNMGGVVEGTVQLKGTTAVISVIEEKEYLPPVGEEQRGDIVSLYDAEVTRMTVRTGTAQVGVGSRVAAGAVLIKGERLSSNSEVLGEVRASGKIYGKVTFHEKHIFSKTEKILMRTDNKKTISQVDFLGLSIGGKKHINEGWESVSTSGKTFFLPIKITRTEYYETVVEERERDVDAYVESLKSAAVLNSAIKAGASEIVTSFTLTEMDGELLMLNIYIQAEVLIGEG